MTTPICGCGCPCAMRVHREGVLCRGCKLGRRCARMWRLFWRAFA